MAHTDYTGWNHIVAVGEGTSIKYYVNGSLVGTAATNHAWDLASIGNYQHSSYNQVFADAIDDVRVWSRSLNAEEITNLYNTSAVLDDGMVAKYAFDYNANDSAGSNNGTITNAVWAYSGSYRYLDFDGTGDYVEVPNATALNSATGSVSLWFKTDASNIQDTALIGKNDGTNTSKTGWQLYIDDNYPVLQVKDSIASFSYTHISENPSFNYVGEWDSKSIYEFAQNVAQNGSTSMVVNVASVTGTPTMHIDMFNPNNTSEYWTSATPVTLTTGNNTINWDRDWETF